jgi:cytochrome c oxidase cbb3-type subunit IV
MDIYDLHSAATVLFVIIFVGIVVWAYAGRRKADFSEAERLPFVGDPGDHS